MALTDNVAAYWKLDEASGSATDYSGNSNTLADTSSRGRVAGIIGNGVDLEVGSSDSMTAADSVSLSITGDLSISMWVNFESLPAGGNQWGLGMKGDTLAAFAWRWKYDQGSGSYDFIASDGANNITLQKVITPSTATWYHLVVTIDVSASSGKLYINAVDQSASVSGTATSIQDDGGTFHLGAEFNTTWFAGFDGVMDEVGIWARELTGAEVTSLYNAGTGLQYPFSTANSKFLMFMGAR